MKTRMTAILITLCVGFGAQATTTHYVVPPNTPGVNPAGDYTSWETAATNLQDAVSVATNNSLVLVSSGHYRLTNQIVITSAITLRSDNNGALDAAGTILDAQFPAYTNRCLFVDDVAAVVEGFTFTNGFAAVEDNLGRGGAIYLNKQGTVADSIVAGNQSAGHGGGVCLNKGGTLAGCVVIGNSTLTNNATAGGGIFTYVLHTIAGLVTNCLIQKNESRMGGGVYAYNDNATWGGTTFVDCDVIDNIASCLTSGEGGAGFAFHRRAFVLDCRVISNRVEKVAGTPYGGGILGHEGILFSGCYIAYNSGPTYGGGICGVAAGTIVTNCVINTNSATWGGGVNSRDGSLIVDSFLDGNSSAAYIQGGTFRNCLITGGGRTWSHTSPGATFQNCTLYGNTEGFVLQQPCVVENCIDYGNTSNWTQSGVGTNSVWRNSCTTPKPAGPSDVDNTDADPRFVDAQNGDFNLRGNSPCIDQGVFRDWMTGVFDLQGRNRVIGAAVDMGAFEYLPSGFLMSVR